jgi:ComF family protein
LYLADTTHLNPLAVAVRALKYRGERAVARCLGRALAERHPLDRDTVVVPVPLHPSRLRERGYNQALLLARALVRRVPPSGATRLVPRALVRLRPTPTQATLAAAARRANLRDAFTARPDAPLGDRTVALVDDVVTTGATADACAAALRRAGAARVVVYAVGRTP